MNATSTSGGTNTSRPATCQPWCTDHEYDPHDPDEPGHCFERIEDSGPWEVSITQGSQQSEPWAYWGNDDSPCPADVRDLAHALLRAADRMDEITAGDQS